MRPGDEWKVLVVLESSVCSYRIYCLKKFMSDPRLSQVLRFNDPVLVVEIFLLYVLNFISSYLSILRKVYYFPIKVFKN